MMAPRDSSRRRYDNFLQALRRGGSSLDGDDSEEPSTTVVRSRVFRGFFRWLRPFLKTLLLLIGLSVAAALVDAARPLLMRKMIDEALLAHDLNTAQKLGALHLLGLMFLGVIVVGQVLAASRNYRIRRVNLLVILTLRRALYHRLLRLPLSKLADMKTGGVIARLTDDVNTTTGLLQLAVVSPAVSLLRLVVVFSIVLFLNWQLAVAALAVIPVVAVLSFLAVRRIRPIYRSIREDVGRVDGRVGEAISGIRALRIFQGEGREQQDYVVGHHTMARKQLLAQRRELLVWGVWSLLIACVGLVIVWYGGYLQLQGAATVGDILAFQWYALMLLDPAWHIVESISELQRSLAAAERLLDVLETPPDKPDSPSARPAPKRIESIAFQNVTFAYREGEPVLRNIDFTVQGGEVVALVGKSGAGKTTLTDLVARFYDPTSGRILLNGRDLRQIQLQSYRDLLGVVQQEVFLFDGTICENIAYARPAAGKAAIIDAARRAQAAEFIERFPDGYDTLVGERGVKLSGGQKQRVVIARALLADPQILILDEATSNLDSESEQLIQQSLQELLHGRTTFVIAHRLSTITHADRILVLDDGVIVEAGRHVELMNRRGRYFEMVTRQQDTMVLE